MAVFGATGFVGRAVVAALSDRGVEVLQLSTPRLTVGQDDAATEVARQRAVVESVAQLLSGCGAVVNAAGVPDASSGDELLLRAANGILPGAIGAACVRARVPRLVHVSSAVVQGYAPTLDESQNVDPFSPYARSKIEGERTAAAFGPDEVVVYRPPSVHAPDRRITRALTRIARSPLATVAHPDAPTPQALVGNVGAAVASLAVDAYLGAVVVHPWEGLTTRTLLLSLGARRVRTIPPVLARATVTGLRLGSRVLRPLGPHARRLELLWFGQQQAPSSLTEAGWTPPIGAEGWSSLAPAPSAQSRSRARDPHSVMYAVTVPSVAYSFLRGQLRYMASQGWNVTLVCSPGRGLDLVREREEVRVVELTTARDIDLTADARSLWQWVTLLRRERPTVLNASTPKAALLSLLAGRITGVPVRIYLVRGLRLESEKGVRRGVLTMMERLSSWSATHVVAVSPSLRDELVRLRLTAGHRPTVIGSGSSNGVQVERLADGVGAVDRRRSREALGIDEGTFVVAFIGRLRRDKGVHELGAAMCVPALSEALLVTQGDVEDAEAARALAPVGGRHIHLGWRDDVYEILALCDAVALPTHREGFPNVVLEAAAAGVPVVTTTATGAVDSVVDGVTGLLVPPNDPGALADALSRLAADPELRRSLGCRASERARSEFASEVIWEATAALYAQAAGCAP